MRPETERAFREHAERDFPCECCGLIVVMKGRDIYVACDNAAATSMEHFVIPPEQYAQAEDMGDIIAVCHSHPNAMPRPSEGDLVSCELSGVQWHIVGVALQDGVPKSNAMCSFLPSGYKAPLVGRSFHHGILDCYSLVRDYYAEVVGVELPNYDREDDWWYKGQNLYLDNYASAGFVPIDDDLQVGDIILMQIRAPTVNHAGVYIGDGKILHHVYGRMSSRDVYNGYWQQNTRLVVRRKGDSK